MTVDLGEKFPGKRCWSNGRGQRGGGWKQGRGLREMGVDGWRTLEWKDRNERTYEKLKGWGEAGSGARRALGIGYTHSCVLGSVVHMAQHCTAG